MIAQPTTQDEIDRAVGGWLWRLNRDDYHLIRQAEILRKGDDVELLNGVIFQRHPRGRTLIDALYRWSREKYHQLAAAGILQEDDPVELLDGLIMMMPPIGPRHGGIVDFLTAFFVARLTGRAIVRVRGSFGIGDESEPQPDIILLKPHADYYRSRLPAPQDVLMLVEVAESSLASDRGSKMMMYAQAGIPEYWLVDLTRDSLEAYSSPGAAGYAQVREHDREAMVAPIAFPDVRLALRELFG